MFKKWSITLFVIILLTAAAFIAVSATTTSQLNDWPGIAILGELIIGILIFGIMKTKTEKDKKKNLSTWSYLGLCMVTPGLIILRLINEIDAGSIINIIVLYGLVIVTIEYAKSTERMANEMKKTRISESLPLLVPKTVFGIPEAYVDHINPKGRNIGVHGKLHNLGNGLAINTRLYIIGIPINGNQNEPQVFPLSIPTIMTAGQVERFNYTCNESTIADWQNIIKNHKLQLKAEYRDIYERDITTTQNIQIQVDKHDVTVGGLFFTINGVRLDEEGQFND